MKILTALLVLTLLPVTGLCFTADAGHVMALTPTATYTPQPGSSNTNTTVATALGVSIVLSLAVNYAWHKWSHSKSARSSREAAILKGLKGTI